MYSFFWRKKVLQWVQKKYTMSAYLLLECIEFHVVVTKITTPGTKFRNLGRNKFHFGVKLNKMHCNGFTSFDACLRREKIGQKYEHLWIASNSSDASLAQKKLDGIAFWNSESVRINLRCSEGGGAGTRISNIHL